MNRQGRVVKEDLIGAAASSSSSSYNSAAAPQPIEGLHDAGPPPFLTKTYDIVEDSNTNHIISWSRANNSFVVWDSQAFSISLLPKYFKHNNFSSFVRQLNTYGFRKVDPDRWEFANEGFLRGQRHLLKNIRRRKTTQPSASLQSLDASCVEVGRFGVDSEVDRLRRDKQVLVVELVKLRQQQQSTKEYLQTVEQRLRRTEMKQQHMMSFLARAMQNPNFVQQLVLQKDSRKEFEEMINRKRRRHIDQGPSDIEIGELGQGEDHAVPFVKVESEEFGDIAEFEVSELDKIAVDMQEGLSESQRNPDGECVERGEEHGSKGKFTMDEGFWEDFLNEDIEDGEGEGDENVDVDVLVEQLGFFSSSPK